MRTAWPRALLVVAVVGLGLASSCSDGDDHVNGQELQVARDRAADMRKEVVQGFRDLERSVSSFARSGHAAGFLSPCDGNTVRYQASFEVHSTRDASADRLLDQIIDALDNESWTTSRNPDNRDEAQGKLSNLRLDLFADGASDYVGATLDGRCVEADEALAAALNEGPNRFDIWATPGVTRLAPSPED